MHSEDPLPGEEQPKEKSYFQKKVERLELEGKSQEEIEKLLEKVREEKRARKERKRKKRIEQQTEMKKLEELKSKKK